MRTVVYEKITIKQWFVASTIMTTGSRGLKKSERETYSCNRNKKRCLCSFQLLVWGDVDYCGMVWSFGGWEHKDRLNSVAKELEELMTNTEDKRYAHVLAQIKH